MELLCDNFVVKILIVGKMLKTYKKLDETTEPGTKGNQEKSLIFYYFQKILPKILINVAISYHK